MNSRLQFPGVLPSKDVISRIKSESNTVILSFSGGKDSIVAWFALREAGLRVVPYFLEQVSVVVALLAQWVAVAVVLPPVLPAEAQAGPADPNQI